MNSLSILNWNACCLGISIGSSSKSQVKNSLLTHGRGLRMLKSIFVSLAIGSVCALSTSCVKDKKEAKQEGQEDIQDAQRKVQEEQRELDAQRSKSQKEVNEKSVDLQKEMTDKGVEAQKDINAEKKDVIEAQKDVKDERVETQNEINKAPK